MQDSYDYYIINVKFTKKASSFFPNTSDCYVIKYFINYMQHVGSFQKRRIALNFIESRWTRKSI